MGKDKSLQPIRLDLFVPPFLVSGQEEFNAHMTFKK